MLHYDWLVLVKPLLTDFNLSIAIDDLLLEIRSLLRILTLTHREGNVQDIKAEIITFNFRHLFLVTNKKKIKKLRFRKAENNYVRLDMKQFFNRLV